MPDLIIPLLIGFSSGEKEKTGVNESPASEYKLPGQGRSFGAGQALGNVSQACRVMGYSRDSTGSRNYTIKGGEAAL